MDDDDDDDEGAVKLEETAEIAWTESGSWYMHHRLVSNTHSVLTTHIC